MERVLRFGEDDRLVGIFNEPEGQAYTHNPIAILLNSGLLHHVGPFRLYVGIARRLSEHGFASLRFDIGGLGDSAPAKIPKNDLEQVLLDIQSAMDALQVSTGVERFVLIGLCTGAANAHRAAVVDRRVVGYCALSGYAYPTIEYYIRRAIPVLRDRNRLKALLKRTISNVIQKRSFFNVDIKTEKIGWWILPPKKQFLEECDVLFGRGVKTLNIFTSGDVYYKYKSQFLDNIRMYDYNGHITVHYNVDSDHTYTDIRQRGFLITEIEKWFYKEFFL